MGFGGNSTCADIRETDAKINVEPIKISPIVTFILVINLQLRSI